MSLFESTFIHSAKTGNSSGVSKEKMKFHHASKSILLVFAILAVGCLVKRLLKKIELPYTVALFALAFIFGYICHVSENVSAYADVTRIPAALLLEVFLPILIFESAYTMDAHYFLRSLGSSLILAVPGLIMSAVLTAVYSKTLLWVYQWDWITCFLFGCILSATDPVSVVALLKEFGISPALTTLIEGESLLNDGSAIVIFQTLFECMKNSTGELNASVFALTFIRVGLGAPIFGYAIGWTTSWILTQIENEPVLEFSITLCSAYFSYNLAEEMLGLSGVLTVVTVGVVVGLHKSSFSPEAEELVHSFWELMGYFANTLIFSIVGIIIAEKSSDMKYTDALLALATYVAVTVIRSVMILFWSPLLRRMGYGLPWKHAIVLIWGGLRGAIGLALSLMLSEEESLDPSIADRILIQLSMIIVLTLIVNGVTMKYLLEVLGLNEIPQTRVIAMAHAVEHLRNIGERSIRIHRRDKLLTDANWLWVKRHTHVKDPYNATEAFDVNCQYAPTESSHCPKCLEDQVEIPTTEEFEEMSEEARLHILKALRVCYWKYFDLGLMSRKSVDILNTIVNEAIDKPGKYIDVNLLQKKYMKVPVLTQQLADSITLLGDKLGVERFRAIDEELISLYNTTTGFRHWCLSLIASPFWEPLIFLVIISNVVPIVFEIRKIKLIKIAGEYSTIYFIAALLYLLIYILEAVIKITGLGWKRYITNHYNQFAFFLVFLCAADVAADITNLFLNFTNGLYIASIRLLRLLRLVELYRMFLKLLGKIVFWLKNKISSRLYHSYDLGRGYIVAQTEVMEKINYLVDYKPCADVPLNQSEQGILKIMKILSNMQEKHRGIVIARKSHIAAINVLNSTKVALVELLTSGLLDTVEFERLEEVISNLKIKIQHSPKFLSDFKSVREILKKVDWLTDKRFFHEVFRSYIVKDYKAQDYIHDVGEMGKGITIIISGVVKIFGTVSPEKRESIPNTDSFRYFVNKKNFFEYVTAGYSLGLIDSVQDSEYVTTAVCQTDVQVLYVSAASLHKADLKMSAKPSMSYFLWRSICLKIAPLILSEVPKYKDISDEKINLKLETCVIPDFLTAEKFSTNMLIEDMVLIQGRVSDAAAGKLYVGPCHIPITDQQDFRPRIVMAIIAEESYCIAPEFDWSGFDSSTSRAKLCLLHTIKHRRSTIADFEAQNESFIHPKHLRKRKFTDTAPLPISHIEASLPTGS